MIDEAGSGLYLVQKPLDARVRYLLSGTHKPDCIYKNDPTFSPTLGNCYYSAFRRDFFVLTHLSGYPSYAAQFNDSIKSHAVNAWPN
jgi:hypothetical protein